MSPFNTRVSAAALPASNAVVTSQAESFPTPCVTRSSPRSLSGAKSQARTRTTLGCPGKSTALAMTVAAASAKAAWSARTVTASAMPSEKLRPCQPLVAMPLTCWRESSAAVPNRDGRSGRSTMPATKLSPGARCSAMSPPLLTYARERLAAEVIVSRISSATAPATAAIGVMKIRSQ